jgi:hypothetical protein
MRLAIVCAVIALAASTGVLASTFPTVQFVGFNSSTFEYTYRVTHYSDGPYGFDEFEIDSWFAPGISVTNTMTGAWVGGVNQAWPKRRTDWYDVPNGKSGKAFIWYAGNVLPNQSWVGDFKIIIPNSQPLPGSVYTSGGGLTESRARHYVNVPSPIPEPTGVLALGSMIVGMTPILLRKRRS